MILDVSNPFSQDSVGTKWEFGVLPPSSFSPSAIVSMLASQNVINVAGSYQTICGTNVPGPVTPNH